MAENNTYGVNVVPQFRGDIAQNQIALGLSYEPSKLDMSAYKDIGEALIKNQQLALDKDKIAYNREILQYKIKKAQDEAINNEIANMDAYLQSYMTDAKNGKSVVSPIPIVGNKQKEYHKKMSAILNSTGDKEKQLKELRYEMFGDETLRKGIEATSLWASSVREINKILSGNKKGYTRDNVDLQKFGKIKDLIASGGEVTPDMVSIENFMKSDPNAIVKSIVDKSMTLRETAKYGDIGGGMQGVQKYASTGDRTMQQIAKDIEDGIKSDPQLLSQFGGDIAKLAEFANKRALQEINNKFGKGYASFSEIPNEPYRERKDIVSVSEAVKSKRETDKIKTENKKGLENLKTQNEEEILRLKDELGLSGASKSSSTRKLSKEERETKRKSNVAKTMLQRTLENDNVDAVVTSDVAQQLADAGVNSISKIDNVSTNGNITTVELTVKGKAGDTGKKMTLRMPTKKALKNKYVRLVQTNKFIAKKGEDDPQYLMEAATFLRSPELQDAVYDKIIPILREGVPKLREYDKKNTYTDSQLMYIMHHSGLKNGIKFLKGEKSDSKNKSDFKELETALPKVLAAEKSGKTDWKDIIDTPGIEGNNGYDSVYQGSESSSALGKRQVLFDTYRDLIRITAAELGIPLGDPDYKSEKDIKDIISGSNSNDKIFDVIAYYDEHYGDIKSLFPKMDDKTIDEIKAYISKSPNVPTKSEEEIINIIKKGQTEVDYTGDNKDTSKKSAVGIHSEDYYTKIVNSNRKGVRKNKDGTFSTHLMASAEIDGRYFAFPTLFQNEDGTWVDYTKKSLKEIIDEAKRRGELYEFKTDKEAKRFAEGSWKKRGKKQNSGKKAKINWLD